MMNILHAVLHVFDMEGGQATFSRRELDMDSRPAKSFVQRHLRRAVNSADNRRGDFRPDSGFAGELEQYLDGRTQFLELSAQIAGFLFDELRRADPAEQCDLLVTDFTDDAVPDAKTKVDVAGNSEVGDGADFADAVDAAMQQALESAYSGQGDRKFAIVLLPRKQAFMHDVLADASGTELADVVRTDAVLPNPTQKLDTYAVINTRTYEIDFVDKERSVAGEQVQILPDALLQCTSHASTREVIQQVTSIVGDVAEEYGSDSAVAVAVARAKAYVAENAAAAESFSPEELGREVFQDEPVMRERYEERAAQGDLPQRVPVRQSVATRMARSHKIRTDTGIEVIFPSEYTSNSDYISFIRQDDGTIRIEIKGIGRIENR